MFSPRDGRGFLNRGTPQCINSELKSKPAEIEDGIIPGAPSGREDVLILNLVGLKAKADPVS
jgi:hypothetical protein